MEVWREREENVSDVMYEAEIIYGTMKFVPPEYTAWKRSFWGKWTSTPAGQLPQYDPKGKTLLVCDTGAMVGPEDLLEAFKRERHTPPNQTRPAMSRRE